jgi:hypothetical protein
MAVNGMHGIDIWSRGQARNGRAGTVRADDGGLPVHRKVTGFVVFVVVAVRLIGDPGIR